MGPNQYKHPRNAHKVNYISDTPLALVHGPCIVVLRLQRREPSLNRKVNAEACSFRKQSCTSGGEGGSTVKNKSLYNGS